VRTNTNRDFEDALAYGRRAEHAVRNFAVSSWGWTLLPELRAPDRSYCGPRITTEYGEYRSPDIVAVDEHGVLQFVEVKRKSKLFYSKRIRQCVVEVDLSSWADYMTISDLENMRSTFTLAVVNEKEPEKFGRVWSPERGLYTSTQWALVSSIRSCRAEEKTLNGKTVIEFPLDCFNYHGTVDWCMP
jgi:hypothetical protein